MTPTAQLLTEQIAELTKQRDRYQVIINDLNAKLTDYEKVLKMIEDESNSIRRTANTLPEQV